MKVNKVSLKIIAVARKLKIFDDTFVLILAGLAGGYFAILFRCLIDYVTASLAILCDYISNGLHFLALYVCRTFSIHNVEDIHGFPELQYIYLPLIPIIGFVLVVLITNFFAKEAKGHGVPEVMSAVTIKGGIIRHRIVSIDKYTLTLNQDLLEVYNEMRVGEQECLPVVDGDNKKLIGIVTRFHVMYRYKKELVLLQGTRATG
ncbi:MAG: CBS domain-containing protein [Candidatus Brocadiaceae bacterium]|nr:CBS domain-containing protein [Candidatus Brocadiaceae bacterium]